MATPEERDFPKGHPKAADYNPKSPEAIEWARKHIHPKGERDWPVDHPAAIDTKGNHNSIEWKAGVDPFHPELEEFTGATPEVAQARKEAEQATALTAKETPMTPQGTVDYAKVNEQAAVSTDSAPKN